MEIMAMKSWNLIISNVEKKMLKEFAPPHTLTWWGGGHVHLSIIKNDFISILPWWEEKYPAQTDLQEHYPIFYSFSFQFFTYTFHG